MNGCTLFPIFSSAPFLKVWQINYCEHDYQRCARFVAFCNSEVVPSTLLPNGKHLPVLNKPEKPSK